MDRYEIRLSGSGGQGMILAGIILSEAVLYEDSLNVTQTQSYGPESRGGASRAEVILSHEEIDYPKVSIPNVLVALTQDAFDKYYMDVLEGGIIIADEKIDISKAYIKKGIKLYSLSILRTAEEKVGMKLSANIVVLGIIDNFINDIKTDSLREAIKKRVPARTVEMNMRAFDLGEELGHQLLVH
jgi:2-oxoglutarate ferredoxin oxidoreductase subunit gamma